MPVEQLQWRSFQRQHRKCLPLPDLRLPDFQEGLPAEPQWHLKMPDSVVIHSVSNLPCYQ